MQTHSSAFDYVKCLVGLASRESEEASEQLTHLYIQKLLYLIQGWALVELGRAAFREPMKAWPHGPVVEEVYQAFKSNGKKPVSADEPDEFSLSAEELDVTRMVWERYKRFSASHLRELTHRDPPWRTARRDLPDMTHCNRNLDLGEVERTFREKSERAEARVRRVWPAIQNLAEANSRRMTGGKPTV